MREEKTRIEEGREGEERMVNWTEMGREGKRREEEVGMSGG